MDIRPCSVDEILAREDLIAEYADECAIAGMPRPQADRAAYRSLTEAGVLYPFGAYRDGVMIGFIIVLLVRFPHYGALSATAESFFVSPSDRKTGAGMRLLRHAERFAKERGAAGLFISSPAGGALEKLMDRLHGYKQSNTVFFKQL